MAVRLGWLECAMPDRSQEFLERYLPRRRAFEVGCWVLAFLLSATINTVVVWLDIDRLRLPVERWQPLVWEWSSNLVLLALVPAVIALERRFPLWLGTFRRHVPVHALAAIAFSLVHVVAMVALRQLAYRAMGSRYDFGSWPRELAYELLKDVPSYVGILVAVYLYRLVLLRLQGEARLLDAPDDGAAVEPVERPERFLVRKLGKEFLVAANDIEWLQASANYVNLHVRGRDYPLRTTMAALEERLDPARFIRVHRSYMVNLDYIDVIEPQEAGEAIVSMRDGMRIPCSRRYRGNLR